MARAENGKNGNPHHHAIAVGEKTPQMGRHVVDDVDAGISDDDVSSVGPEEKAELEKQLPKLGDDAEGESEASEEVHLLPPPAPHPAARSRAKDSKRGRKGSRLVQRLCGAGFSAQQGERCEADGAGVGGEEGPQSLKAMEAAFWECFGDIVSEWNPCYSEEGHVRYTFDGEVGAHNVEVDCTKDLVRDEPIRVNLRAVLDKLFADEAAGRILDLRPVRRLVASLVQKCGRHDRHGELPPKKSDACARGGKGGCFFCRYGYPKKGFHGRSGERKLRLRKGDREGSWEAQFPRNDPLCTSFEPHVLLANMGNIDWRPCLNLWAVVEYICKYATKAPEGSRTMSETLKSAAEEICKYTREGEAVDFFRKALQKFYAKSIGERDFSVFEAVHLGLRLPTVFPLMPVISLNTLGSRKMKTKAELERDGRGDDAEVSWDSKVDKFDKRLALVRKQFEKNTGEEREEIESLARDVSLFEFFWKYYFRGKRMGAANQTWALMVTPSMAASSASIFHERHEPYARGCVVAFWRHMPTFERYALMVEHAVAADRRRWGGTLFQAPAVVAGFPLQDRYLGIRDLVHAFEGARRQEVRWRRASDGSALECFVKERKRGRAWKYGWTMALMEMLADPVLSEWVPAWVREQYFRWNPDFLETLEKVLREDTVYGLCNREVLCATRKAMGLKYKKREARLKKKKADAEEEQDGDSDSSVGSDAPPGGSEKGSDDGEENGDPSLDVKKAWHRDVEPGMGDGDGEVKEAGERWAALSPEELLSAAPPAPAASDSVAGSAFTSSGQRQVAGGHVNPRGYRWDVDNFVPQSSVPGMDAAWKKWRDVSVRGEVEVVPREELDSWQKFAYDILSNVRHGVRLFLTGTAGTGKSRTVRSFVTARQKVIYEKTLSESEADSRAEAEKAASSAAQDSCVLAAPTGCASFQMKLGAATIHRIFGVPVGFCGPAPKKRPATFLDRARRLKAASLFVLDEFSMIGRKMLGKLVFRAREVFQDPRGEPFPDRDFVMAGDPKQAQPVGDEPMYKPGAYTGSDQNKPKKRQAPEGTPSAASLVDSGVLFRKSFDDVVLLREVHRVDKGDDSMSEAERTAYSAEADRFLEIITKMADCEWDFDDYKFLQARNKSFLRRTPEGRRVLE